MSCESNMTIRRHVRVMVLNCCDKSILVPVQWDACFTRSEWNWKLLFAEIKSISKVMQRNADITRIGHGLMHVLSEPLSFINGCPTEPAFSQPENLFHGETVRMHSLIAKRSSPYGTEMFRFSKLACATTCQGKCDS